MSPNASGLEPQTRDIYRSFGLNARQIEIIACATPKRDYYLQSRDGDRLFDLQLGPIARAFCAASSQHDQVRIKKIIGVTHGQPFAPAWLRANGVQWAADLIDHETKDGEFSCVVRERRSLPRARSRYPSPRRLMPLFWAASSTTQPITRKTF